MTVVLSRLHLLHAVTLFSLILLIGLAPPLAAQQEPAGRVTVVLGTVEAESPDGERRTLRRGDPVYEGDTLHSGPRGRAQIRFSDRGMVSLRPDSTFGLDSYQDDDASPAAKRQEMSLSRGGFRAQTGRIAQANRQGYRVQSPVAVIGIRGTVFDAHQHPGGALLVGATEGGVEVESSAGVIGRIGAGESFNYLRVNPDGSIDYLLEVPDEFTLSPEVDEGDEDEALDAGDASQSSINTGAGAAESTAGIVTGSGDQLVDVTNDPDATGIVSPSQTGSGDPPVASGQPVLDPAQIDLLLADDRIGVALGVPSVSVGPDGELQVGSPTLQGGIATFNSPLLALSSSRAGFGSGLAAAARSDLLSEADLLLLPDSAESESRQDVGGVPGLIWGRYLAPVLLFADPSDSRRVLELQRDVLFLLGTPADIATLQGEHVFTITDFDAVSSGLPISDVFASGLLDVGQARYVGLLDILLGEDSATGASLFAEFGADVRGGVLEDIDFGTLNLFDFADESTLVAEGELAGFFTGDAAAFLQLAFDFRVPDRDDADVAGLVLLARELTMDVLTSEQQTALIEGDAVALVLGVEPTALDATAAGEGLLGRGIATLLDGEPVLAVDTRFAAIPRGDRGEALAGADGLFTSASGNFELDENVEGSGLTWGVFSAPVQQFVNPTDVDERLQLERDLAFVLGTPVDIAVREGVLSYEAVAAMASSSGLPVLEVAGGAALDFDDAVLFGFLDVYFGAEAIEAEIIADFRSSVEAGVLVDLEFLFLQFRDLIEEDGSSTVQADLAGFFAGSNAEFLQLAFDFRVDGRSDADVSGLALLREVEEITGGALTPEEFFALQEGFFFVAVNCCFEDGGMPTGTLAGRATDASLSGGQDTLLAFSLDDDGTSVAVADPRFARRVPDVVVRREGAEVANFDEDEDSGLAAFEWHGFDSPARAFEAVEGDAVRDFEQNLLVLTGRPTLVADLTGFARYQSLDLVQGFAIGGGEVISVPFADMSFNVNFADGSVTDGVFRAPLDVFGDFDGGEDFGPEQNGSVFFGPTMEAFFTGQVTLDGEQAFVDFEVTEGGIAGEGTDPLDLERSVIDGFFSGEDAELFAAAFHLETTGFDNEADRVLAVGNIVLGRQDLSLTDIEASLFAESGLAFVGVACCGLETSSFRGGATEFGLNSLLGVGANGAMDGAFPVLLRRTTATPMLLGARGDEGGALAESVAWSVDGGVPLRVDADSGDILERVSSNLLYHVAMPLDIATLEAGFTTFWGDPAVFESSASQFGLDASGGMSSEGFSASFNVDLDTGDIFTGHLFVVEERVQDGSDLSELGFEVFFDGFVAVDGDTPFAELNILGGSYRQRTPLNLDTSNLDGFFAEGIEQIFFAGSYDLRGDGEGDAAGIFEISNVDMIETRLSREDVESWVRFGPEGEARPGFGMAVFRHGPDTGRRAPGDGFLLGRASDPNSDERFVLGANALRREATGEHAFVGSDSRDFFGQPFDFILREDLALEMDFNDDARPPDGPTFEGFEVSWGAWAGDDGAPGQVRELGSEVSQGVQNVFFASINPTPTSQLPVEGMWSFDSAIAGTAFFGVGGESSLLTPDAIEDLTVGFMLDFGSGAISDGALEVTYGEGTVQWNAQFDGFLSGAVTEFDVTSLEVLRNGNAIGIDGTPDTSMAGMLTGPEGQRHVGGFNLAVPTGSGSFESVHGIWVVDGAPQ